MAVRLEQLEVVRVVEVDDDRCRGVLEEGVEVHRHPLDDERHRPTSRPPADRSRSRGVDDLELRSDEISRLERDESYVMLVAQESGHLEGPDGRTCHALGDDVDGDHGDAPARRRRTCRLIGAAA